MEKTSNGQAARILIVDDNFDAANTTRMLLEYSGHRAEILIDGRECLSRMASFNPDVVLLDIAMPGISGYDLAKQVRSQPQFEKLPIIALSGYADGEYVQRSLDFGCNRHLIKPVFLDVLMKPLPE
jgi:CheY-like chemotaxis protein